MPTIARILLGLLLSGFAAQAEDKASPQLTLYTVENSPFSYIDEQTGSFTGAGHDVLMRLLKETGITYSVAISDLPFKRLLRKIETSDNTCFFVLNRTKSREDRYQWVGPLVSGGWAFYKRPGSDVQVASFEDLKKYVITGLQFTAPIVALQNEGIDVLDRPTNADALKLIAAGRADLILGGVVDIPVRLKEHGYPQMELAYHWKVSQLSLGCSLTTDKALIDALNTANTPLTAYRAAVLKEYVDAVKVSDQPN
ncbi:hypothetical protein GCM10017044_19720 [Kordiimonas sediminis]|uniref:Solute-binding protein family 3/N-terminal domain-containing protein n=1 Tax=Kordiimonas sediminis TaxID=1735581 RepID=A0A919AU25_9PROT|nr:hypothetical protein GCM10017044_19720 [Kordiimonas sediminis]